MPSTGAANAITDVAGLLVVQDTVLAPGWATGATVVLAPDGTTAAVDQLGGAPGTRETNALEPENLVTQIDAVCLAGGSAYGLAAADGVMTWLAERERGLPVGAASHEVVPIVPAAVLFDLPRSHWGNRPDAEFGYRACAAATDSVNQGTLGAGTGAVVGSLKGGVGTASEVVDGFTVGALAVVNAAGEAVDTRTGLPYGADHEVGTEFGVLAWPNRPAASLSVPPTELNTTIGVVAVDADLSKAECRRLAVAAQDGLARSVRPAHSMFDEDTVFALATGGLELAPTRGKLGDSARAAPLDALCSAAARVFTRSMVHGLVRASTAADVRAYHDVWPEAFGG